MIITKEQQEALLEKYMRENHNTDECIGFIDGINALFELLSNIEKRNNMPKQEQAQYSLNQQLSELGVVADRLGLYDAADFIEKTLTK